MVVAGLVSPSHRHKADGADAGHPIIPSSHHLPAYHVSTPAYQFVIISHRLHMYITLHSKDWDSCETQFVP